MSEPPPRVSGQVRFCDTTPAEYVFTNNELVELVSKANVLRENPPAPVAMPHFVSLHKIFLVSCLLCLFHNEGYCASFAIRRSLDDCQISIQNLKRTSLCDDCLRRSKCCPFCISINKEVSLEKKRENSFLLNAIEVKSDPNTG